jgi:hypothetical protein
VVTSRQPAIIALDGGYASTDGDMVFDGDRLICVRHRYDPATGRRCTTVELIEEEIRAQPQDRQIASAPPRPHPNVLALRIEYWESDLRAKVKAAGGIWRPRHKLWELRYDRCRNKF